MHFIQRDGRSTSSATDSPMTTNPLRYQIKTALIDVIGGDAYDCTRVWEAWGVGTMDSDDFVPVIERVDEIADEVCCILAAAEQAEGKQ